MASLANFAEIPQSFSKLAGGYSPKPIDLPTDEEICRYRETLSDPGWRWAYSMMAVYGLRNHEVFRLDMERLTEGDAGIAVKNDSKTGYRLTYPCLAKWREEWRLWEVTLPKINVDRSNIKVGGAVNFQFRKRGVPFIPYALRHAWCIRLSVQGVDPLIASKWAGHSLKVHEQLYHAWINEGNYQRAWQRMKDQEDLDS